MALVVVFTTVKLASLNNVSANKKERRILHRSDTNAYDTILMNQNS